MTGSSFVITGIDYDNSTYVGDLDISSYSEAFIRDRLIYLNELFESNNNDRAFLATDKWQVIEDRLTGEVHENIKPGVPKAHLVFLNNNDDTYSASNSNTSYTIYGGIGNDTITGGGGSDIIDGGIGLDIIDSGAGADRVYDYGNGGTIRLGLGIDNLYDARGRNLYA